jgi:hypothetical protein
MAQSLDPMAFPESNALAVAAFVAAALITSSVVRQADVRADLVNTTHLPTVSVMVPSQVPLSQLRLCSRVFLAYGRPSSVGTGSVDTMKSNQNTMPKTSTLTFWQMPIMLMLALAPFRFMN